MAFSPGMAIGLARGLQDYQESLEKKRLEAKEDEKLAYARQFAEDERTYNRGRNTVADQQAQQTFNQQQLANGLAIGAAQRKDEADKLNDGRQKSYDLGSGYVISGNTSGLADLINPMIPSGINDEMPKVIANADGTSVVNVYSKSDPTKLIRSGRTFKDADELFSYMQPLFDPTGARAAKAKLAEEQRSIVLENAKAERDQGYALQLEGVKGQNTRANSLFNAGLNIERDGLNWDRKTIYAQQNPSGTGTSKTPPIQSAWGVNSLTQSVMPSLWGVESGGRHTDSTGRLTQSPVGALGIGQLMPGTIKDPGFGITPPRDNSQEENMRVSAQYFQAMQNRYGDLDLALAAYNAGPGNVDNAIKAAKQKGGDWKNYLPKPSETIPYIAKVKQNMQNGAYEQVLGNTVATANQVRINADSLAAQAVIDFKDFEGMNPVAVKTAIIGASRHIESALTARTVEERNQSIDRANDVLKATFGGVLPPQQFNAFSQDTIRALAGDKSFTSFAINANPQSVQAGSTKASQLPLSDKAKAAVMGGGSAKTGKPATTTAKPAAQPNIATVLSAVTNGPKPHTMSLDAVKKEIGVIQGAIKSGQASVLQQHNLNERLKALTKALPNDRHISLSDTVSAVTDPFTFKLQTGLPGGAGSVQSNSHAANNQSAEARKQLGL